MLQFGDLPFELRALIWSFAILPRVTYLRIECGDDPTGQKDYFASREPTPSILHACRESRQLALDHYQKVKLYPDSSERGVWINFAMDIVDFGVWKSARFTHYLPMIRRVRLYFDFENEFCYGLYLEELPLMVNLEQCFVYVDRFQPWSLRSDGLACAREDVYFIDKEHEKMINATALDARDGNDAGQIRSQDAMPAPSDAELVKIPVRGRAKLQQRPAQLT
ncbi:hypothetical protein NLG97_g9062 [Lecanicillium saksenae]|uniref:Uncharacterized protein n=1 Tax=Lecanicillium saksenae TaxID=468837 RepID=A0ACC1QIY1_9HYPO|nr:hypothetical protein NLG97_g9062 [Lecanicillium saksenae]